MVDITPVEPFKNMTFRLPVSPKVLGRRNRNKKSDIFSRESFSTLSRLAEDTHLNLIAEDSPIRLCIHLEKDEVVMDIAALDEAGKIHRLYNRIITHDTLDEVGRRIDSRTGLVLDYSV